MERYERYKDSGIEWLGEIPEHWELLKMKYAFEERNTKGFPNEPLLSATQMYGVIPQSLYENRTVVATKGLDTLKLVNIGDFIISLRSFQGGIEYAYYKGIISPAYTVLEPKQISNMYFKYLGKSNIFIQLLKSCVTGIREGQNIDYNILKENYLPIPPFAEQEAIANFLDKKCEQIDRAVAQKKQAITLLNERRQIVIQRAVTRGLNPDVALRDSGIDWIGQIPEHWEVKRLKNIVKIFGRIGFRGYKTGDLVDENEGAITLSPSNMISMSMNYSKCSYLSWAKYYESPEIMIENRDILFVKTGATYGKSTIVNNLPKEATINPQIVVLKNILSNERYLIYTLQTPYIKIQIENSVIGGTIPTISQEKISNYLIVQPPLSEQESIANHLDTVNEKIDRAISLKREEIEKLKEYKQTLINSAVTGKIKIA